MFQDWIRRGLKKDGKTQQGLAEALSVDRTAVSKLLAGTRQLKADEINKVAAYLGEPPPSRIMPVRYTVGAGQVCTLVDEDGPIDHEPVSGMWGVEAELAVVRGDSMWPMFDNGTKLFFGPPRAPSLRDHNKMRVVRLADDRVFVKVMKRTAEPGIWDLESFNAPPIQGRAVFAVSEILRIEPAG